MIWTYDLDGTLFHHDPWPTDFTRAEMLTITTEPCERAMNRVRELAMLTAQPPVYITGRPERLRDITQHQLDAAGAPIGQLFMRPPVPGFAWDVCKHWKASVLRPFNPAVYVGDQVNDREAAQLAGAGYLDDEAFRAMTIDQLLEHADQVHENLARRAER